MHPYKEEESKQVVRSPKDFKKAGVRYRKRPYASDPGVLEVICERLIGGESLGTICKDESMPYCSEVYQYAAKDQTFFSEIARARVLQQDAWAAATIDMADNATPEDYNVVKLRIWARQWYAAKLAPKKYGDKVAVTGAGGTVNNTLTVNIATEKYLQMARQLLEEN